MNRVKHLLCVLLVTAYVHANAANLTGKVVDQSGAPLVGATIVQPNTQIGTTSDMAGNFVLNLPDKKTRQLKISYIGFIDEYITYKGQSSILITLRENQKQLDEVVVVGYGIQRKLDLTSSISTVNPELLQKMPGGVTEALQGNVAGVNVSGGKVRIRGVGSINNTDPLWVVDGFIGGRVPNENEIESIQVLKDAASCAIYGARGANGVIIVTTKKGKNGEAKIEYNGYGGIKWVSNQLELMNATDFSLMVNESIWNYNQQTQTIPQNLPSAYANPYQPEHNTNWQNAWFNPGNYQSHNVTFSGGGKNTTLRVGLNYASDKDITINKGLESYGLITNGELKKGIFTIGESLQVNYSMNHDGGGNYSEILRQSPLNPIYDQEGPHGYYLTGQGKDGNDLVNQIAERNLIEKRSNSLDVKSLTYVQVDLFKGLQYRFNMGIDMYQTNTHEYKYAFDLGRVQNETDDLSEATSQYKRILFENTLTYTKKIAKHNFSVMLGITSEEWNRHSIGASASNFPGGVINLSAAQDNASKSVTGTSDAFAMYSQLARVTYDYDSKYLLTANVRRDGSSKFVKKNRYGYFPSVSVGWRVSEESFVKDNLTWVNNLKLRAGYGLLGNQDIDSYAYESSVEIANQYYVFNNQLVPAPVPMIFGNAGLKWETTYQIDLGFDFTALNNRLEVIVDYFDRKTKDMLVKVATPTTSGSSQGVYMNAGSVRNQGWEFTLNWHDKINEFGYAVGANATFVNNKVLELGYKGEPIYAGFTEGVGNVTRTAEGSSIGRFYGYKTDGIFKTQAEIDRHVYTDPQTGATTPIQPHARPGDLKFIDRNNNGKLDDDDKEYIGSPIPKVSVGLSIDLNYKGFDLSIMGQGDLGNSVYNNGRSFLMHGSSAVNQMALMNDRFRAEELVFHNGYTEIRLPQNTDTNIPRAVFMDPNGNYTRPSDYFIEDGSYFRIKRIILGYTFPTKWMNRIYIDKLRIYAGVKNPFIFTSYTFFDPEVLGTTVEQGGANLNRGIDLQRPWSMVYPASTELYFGLQLTL